MKKRKKMTPEEQARSAEIARRLEQRIAERKAEAAQREAERRASS
jgi:hypothetical protein